MILHNIIGREELKKRLHEEQFRRNTLSFYRYFLIDDPLQFRNELYYRWSGFNCFGRIYVAKEGVNAQLSVPKYNLGFFLDDLKTIRGLENIHVNNAVEDDGKSFYKLTIKVRDKIVADGMDDNAYDVTDVGNHLLPIEFHNMVKKPDSIVVDIRNDYEYEVGHFKGAYTPGCDTFRNAIQVAVEDLSGNKDKHILLYCTGGIRCEKASAYFRHQGFKRVSQLQGGIITYAHQIKQLNIDSAFTGKNFVFDERLGESIDGKIIAQCHLCGAESDDHTNCANEVCHKLFIQCSDCSTKYKGCCSDECLHYIEMPTAEFNSIDLSY